MRRALLLVLAFAFYAAPEILATDPGSVDLVTDRPVDLDGTLRAATLLGSAVVSDDHATGLRVLENATGTLSIWTWNASHVERGGVPFIGNITAQNRLGDASVTVFPVERSSVRIDLHDEGFGLRLVPRPGGSVAAVSDVLSSGTPTFLPAPEEDSLTPDATPGRQPDEVPWRWEKGWLFHGSFSRATHHLGWPSDGAVLHASGPVRLQANGGNVSFVDSDGTARTARLGNWTVQDPAGPAVVQTFAWAIFDGTVDDAAFPAGNTWGLAGPDVAWTLDGRAGWSAADGAGSVNGSAASFARSTVVATGHLVIRPSAEPLPGTTRYAVEGDFETLYVSGQPALRLQSSAVGRTVTAISVAALLAAALALGPRLLGAFYARVAPDRVPDSPTRESILAQVARRPGIHKRELQRLVRLAWGRFDFHFYALLKAGVIRTERHGKYMLVYSSAGGPAPHVAIPHPIARALYESLPLDGSPLAFAAVRDRLGISYQLAKYHVGVLERRGLVVSTALRDRTPAVARTARSVEDGGRPGAGRRS